MPEITDIINGASQQFATPATSKTLTEIGAVLPVNGAGNIIARRVKVTFDLKSSDPTDPSIIGRFTHDGQSATDTFGTQFQYGTVLELSIDQFQTMEFIKLSTAPAVNFMVDYFRYEQQML